MMIPYKADGITKQTRKRENLISEEVKAQIRMLIDEVYHKGNLDALNDFYRADVVFRMLTVKSSNSGSITIF